jgi:hypothetical protein
MGDAYDSDRPSKPSRPVRQPGPKPARSVPTGPAGRNALPPTRSLCSPQPQAVPIPAGPVIQIKRDAVGPGKRPSTTRPKSNWFLPAIVALGLLISVVVAAILFVGPFGGAKEVTQAKKADPPSERSPQTATAERSYKEKSKRKPEFDPKPSDSTAADPPTAEIRKSPQSKPEQSNPKPTKPNPFRPQSPAVDADGAPAPSPDDPELKLVDLVAAVKRSVVKIDVRAADKKGMGSGFVVDKRGTVVTNYHVIEGAERADVSFADKRRARVMGFVAIEKGHDLALLRIDCPADRLYPLAICDVKPKEGEDVVAARSDRRCH